MLPFPFHPLRSARFRFPNPGNLLPQEALRLPGYIPPFSSRSEPFSSLGNSVKGRVPAPCDIVSGRRVWVAAG